MPFVFATFLIKMENQAATIAHSKDWESFKEIKLLGSGSFGLVFKIETWEGFRAVKISFPSDFDANVNVQAQREYDVIKKLPPHENVVRIYDFVAVPLGSEQIQRRFYKPDLLDSETHYTIEKYIARAQNEGKIMTTFLQMELCGPSLRSWLVDESQTNCPHVQTEIIRNLINGVKFLHNNSVMHRDLKPSNIMFSRLPSTGCEYSFPVKIGDFGNSRCYSEKDEDRTNYTMTKGTLAYAAPEVMSGNYGFQADLYSLGLIMWEVLQRIPPRAKASYFDRLVNDRDTELVQEHPIIENAEDLIISLTQRRLDRRTSSINDVELIINAAHNKYIASARSPSDESPCSSMESCSSANLGKEPGNFTHSDNDNPGQLDPKDVSADVLQFYQQEALQAKEKKKDISLELTSPEQTSTSQLDTLRAYIDRAVQLGHPDDLFKDLISLMEARLGNLNSVLQSQSFKDSRDHKTFIHKF
ncbi:mitogen-activated protein kinase 3 isoform X2 [Folsomia candida]|uniref:mitogen-activated protein kinase 3 isoform X2 n=1 Tax=Folsomia candida TaxID=158441 RepID=UPI001604CC5F|nr:mitogen-activated protein kinase 3 isoform X2 [Folsomia candida]